MMIFDGHADLLYDVTKWRQAGEDHVFERRHPLSYTHLTLPTN